VKTGEPQGKVSTDADKKTQRLCSRHFSEVFAAGVGAGPCCLYTRSKRKTAITNSTMAGHPLGTILSLPFRPALLSW